MRNNHLFKGNSLWLKHFPGSREFRRSNLTERLDGMSPHTSRFTPMNRLSGLMGEKSIVDVIQYTKSK